MFFQDDAKQYITGRAPRAIYRLCARYNFAEENHARCATRGFFPQFFSLRTPREFFRARHVITILKYVPRARNESILAVGCRTTITTIIKPFSSTDEVSDAAANGIITRSVPTCFTR